MDSTQKARTKMICITLMRGEDPPNSKGTSKKRREILSALGMGVGGMALLGSEQAGAQEQHHHHDKLHVACLKACSDCANVCNETFHHCFEKVKDGHKAHNRLAASRSTVTSSAASRPI